MGIALDQMTNFLCFQTDVFTTFFNFALKHRALGGSTSVLLTENKPEN